MSYSIEYVNGHIEVYDADGAFLFSADTRQEAVEELQAAFLGLGQILAPNDGQGQVGVELRGDLVGFVARHLGMHLQPRIVRPIEGFDAAHPGGELVVRVLGVDAALDGVAPERDLLLGQGQLLAPGDPDLPAD